MLVVCLIMLGTANADKIAKWNGSSWSDVGTGLSGPVSSLTSVGSDLYVGGTFANAGGNVNADKIAKWNGSSWSSLGTGLDKKVNSITSVGSDLYIGGWFTNTGYVANTDKIAKWNGSGWSALGAGLTGSGTHVADLAIFPHLILS